MRPNSDLGGRLVFAETVRLDGDIGAKLKRPAVAKGGVAIGTALIVPGDEALLTRIREASESLSGEVGISAWNGFAIARFCAQDAAKLRSRRQAGVCGNRAARWRHRRKAQAPRGGEGRRRYRYRTDRARRRGAANADSRSLGVAQWRGRHLRLERLCNRALLCTRCGQTPISAAGWCLRKPCGSMATSAQSSSAPRWRRAASLSVPH